MGARLLCSAVRRCVVCRGHRSALDFGSRAVLRGRPRLGPSHHLIISARVHVCRASELPRIECLAQ